MSARPRRTVRIAVDPRAGADLKALFGAIKAAWPNLEPDIVVREASNGVAQERMETDVRSAVGKALDEKDRAIKAKEASSPAITRPKVSVAHPALTNDAIRARAQEIASKRARVLSWTGQTIAAGYRATIEVVTKAVLEFFSQPPKG